MANTSYHNTDWHSTTEWAGTHDDSASQHAHDSNEGLGYNPSLSNAIEVTSRSNTGVRASQMHGMQRTHGNRAVQRALNVQRFTEPAPWLGYGERGRDQAVQVVLPPNLGMEPGPGYGSQWQHSGPGIPLGEIQPGYEPGYGSQWQQSPHSPGGMPLGEIQPGGYPLFPNLGQAPSYGSQWQQTPHGPGGSSPKRAVPDPFGPGPFYNPTPDIPLPFHPMPGGGTGFGWQPPGKGEMPGPWAYYKGHAGKPGDMSTYGVEGGFGAFHGEADMLGIPVTDDILFFNGKLGHMQDGKDHRTGYNFNAGVGKATFNQGGKVSGDIGVLTAGSEVSYGTDGMTAGATANLVEGSMTFGAPDKSNPYDESVRVGGSIGMGYAGRVHWGDKDGDGSPEYGFGFDAGPLSLDLKSEDPARTLVNAATGGYLNGFLPQQNLTNYVGKEASSLWDSAKEYLPW